MTCSADPSREESKLSSPSKLARDTTKEAREREGKERRGERGKEGGGGRKKREEGRKREELNCHCSFPDKYMCMNAIPHWSYDQL